MLTEHITSPSKKRSTIKARQDRPSCFQDLSIPRQIEGHFQDPVQKQIKTSTITLQGPSILHLKIQKPSRRRTARMKRAALVKMLPAFALEDNCEFKSEFELLPAFAPEDNSEFKSKFLWFAQQLIPGKAHDSVLGHFTSFGLLK